jgi:pimeloyl-ACP methyl ester carboxylesterase
MAIVDSLISTTNGQVSVRQSTGTGMPLLMIHGSGASKEVFAHQFAHAMADTHRMVALDLPGHGASSDAPDPRTAYTLEGLADTVGEVIDQLGLAQVALFGWSLGGHIAIELLDRHPAIAGVMLTGTPPVSRGPLAMLRAFHTSWDLLLTSKEIFTTRDIERFGRLCYGDDVSGKFLDMIARTDGRVRTAVFKGLARGEWSDQRQTVERAQVPLAVVNGANESVARLSYIESLSCPTLWHGKCYVLPGAGHAPFLQTPGRFNGLLSAFVDDVGSLSARGHQAVRSA